MSTEEKELLKKKLKSSILDSGEDFLKMKKRLHQKIVVSENGKIITVSADYFLKKQKN